MKIDNLINFVFNFSIEMGNNPYYSSPDYFLEKWDKYIGIEPPFKYSLESELVDKYNNSWVVPDNIKNKLSPILEFVFEINNHSIWKQSPSTIIDIFSKYFNFEDIKESDYNGLHKIVQIELEKWKENNSRDYNLIKLDV